MSTTGKGKTGFLKRLKDTHWPSLSGLIQNGKREVWERSSVSAQKLSRRCVGGEHPGRSRRHFLYDCTRRVWKPRRLQTSGGNERTEIDQSNSELPFRRHDQLSTRFLIKSEPDESNFRMVHSHLGNMFMQSPRKPKV